MPTRDKQEASEPETGTLDTLLQDLGGCKLFQILVVPTLLTSIAAPAWSIGFIAFSVYNPGWTCGDSKNSLNESMELNTSISCYDFASCKTVIYSDDSSTIVTEWNLACDRFYIMSSLISIQMGGTLLGNMLSGYLCQAIGRKPIHFLSLAMHAALHLLAAFSVNLEMFTALRFFIGVTTGILSVTSYLYPIEFIPANWRSVVSAIPFWNIGSISFAVMAMLLRNWRHLNLATGIFSVFLLVLAIWTPESMRWLAGKGEVGKAHRVGSAIAKFNRRDEPNMELINMIAEEEKRRKETDPRMGILCIYRRDFLLRTVITSYLSFCNNMIYYIIFLAIKSLSGDFYINLLILSHITLIPTPFVGMMATFVGRKWCLMCCYALAFLSCVCMISLEFITGFDKGLAILVLSFVVLLLITVSWNIKDLHISELFPTPFRSIALSHAATIGKIGGMVAPFLVPVDASNSLIPNIVMAVFLLICFLILALLPETRKKQMEDYVKQRKVGGRASNNVMIPRNDAIENQI